MPDPESATAIDAESKARSTGIDSTASPKFPKTKKTDGARRTEHWAIRECAGLHGPAVFTNEVDARNYLNNDRSAICRRFLSMEDADNFIHNRRRNKRKSPSSAEHTNDSSMTTFKNNVNAEGPMDKNDEIWEENFQKLKVFAATMGDGNPNLATRKEYKQPKLQSWIMTQRREYLRYVNGDTNDIRSLVNRKERFYRLLELGLRLKPEEPPTPWKAMAQKWRDFTLEHPTVPLLETVQDETVVELAKWQSKQIEDFIKMIRKEGPHELFPHRYKLLKEWKFPFPNDVKPPKKTTMTFDDRLQEFISWKETSGTPMVPQSLDGLGQWVKEQRKEYRKWQNGETTCMTQHRIQKLEDAGFVFRCRAPKFDDRLHEFISWKGTNGTAMVPQSLDGLGLWVKEQRKEYCKWQNGKTTCMTQQRIQKLQDAGFVFRCRTPRSSICSDNKST